MCVYIQVNTQITICRPEQIAQARLGCSGDPGQTNENAEHYGLVLFFVFCFPEKEVRNCKTVNTGDLAADRRWKAAHAQPKKKRQEKQLQLHECLFN